MTQTECLFRPARTTMTDTVYPHQPARTTMTDTVYPRRPGRTTMSDRHTTPTRHSPCTVAEVVGR